MNVLFTVGDLVGIAASITVGLVALCVVAREAFQQQRCKHLGGVNETQACNAICRQCGKNLGFIGKWRKSSTTPLEAE